MGQEKEFTWQRILLNNLAVNDRECLKLNKYSYMKSIRILCILKLAFIMDL